jgi:hypothetical protein
MPDRVFAQLNAARGKRPNVAFGAFNAPKAAFGA